MPVAHLDCPSTLMMEATCSFETSTMTFNGPHSVIFQKAELFITKTVVGISNPKYVGRSPQHHQAKDLYFRIQNLI
jgi:hypothetical protein